MLPDLELAEHLRRGSEEAFEVLYQRYSSPLLHHLLCMVGKKELAEEILHEVFMTVLTKINFFEDDPKLLNSFKAWVYRIATNRAIDEIRKQKRTSFTVLEEEMAADEDIESTFSDMERNRKVQSLLLKLPLAQRTFLNLKLNVELSHFEIARICSCEVNTVKQGLFQARRSLKNLLLKEGVEL